MKVFVIDAGKCSGCYNCQIACQARATAPVRLEPLRAAAAARRPVLDARQAEGPRPGAQGAGGVHPLALHALRRPEVHAGRARRGVQARRRAGRHRPRKGEGPPRAGGRLPVRRGVLQRGAGRGRRSARAAPTWSTRASCRTASTCARRAPCASATRRTSPPSSLPGRDVRARGGLQAARLLPEPAAICILAGDAWDPEANEIVEGREGDARHARRLGARNGRPTTSATSGSAASTAAAMRLRIEAEGFKPRGARGGAGQEPEPGGFPARAGIGAAWGCVPRPRRSDGAKTREKREGRPCRSCISTRTLRRPSPNWMTAPRCTGPAPQASGCHNLGCGLKAYVKDGALVKVEGDPDHPISQGRLCVRCLTAREYLYHEDRLLYPMRRAREDRGQGRLGAHHLGRGPGHHHRAVPERPWRNTASGR